MKTCPLALPLARVSTSTAGGLRSGRERKSQARPEAVDDPFCAGHTLESSGFPLFGVLASRTRSRRSQPVKAKYVTPAPIAARNRRRVRLEFMALLYTDHDPETRSPTSEEYNRTSRFLPLYRALAKETRIAAPTSEGETFTTIVPPSVTLSIAQSNQPATAQHVTVPTN